MVVKNISNPITPPESPNSKVSSKSDGLSSSGLNSFDRFMKKNKKRTPSLSGLTLSSGTNSFDRFMRKNKKRTPSLSGLTLSSGTKSFDRFMKKNKNKKPSPSLLNREMNKARGEEILKLKKDIEYLKNVIKDRDDYINRLHNWNVYSNMKPALCNKRSIIKKGRLKKKLSENKRKKNSKSLKLS